MNRKKNFIKANIIWIFIASAIFFSNVLFLNCNDTPIRFKEADTEGDRLNLSDIEINNGDLFTNKTKVNLLISSPSAIEMYISNSDCESGGYWESYKDSRDWRIDVRNVEAFVYISFKDDEELISQCFQDSIIHDDISPEISFNKLIMESSSRSIKLSYSVQDNLSGFKQALCKINDEVKSCSKSELSFIGESRSYIAQIVVTDQAGNESDIFKKDWDADFDPPTVSLTHTPPNPSWDTGLVFEFRGVDRHSPVESLIYKCSLGGGPPSGQFTEVSCASPYTLPNQPLSEGDYTFTVVALDEAGNRSTPALYSWEVVELNTRLSFTQKPDSMTNDTNANFAFVATDDSREPL